MTRMRLSRSSDIKVDWTLASLFPSRFSSHLSSQPTGHAMPIQRLRESVSALLSLPSESRETVLETTSVP